MSEYPQTEQPGPNPDLQSLDKLIGTWKQSGGVTGEVTYEWMEGGYFLVQRVDLEQDGHRIKGLEIIGHLQPFGDGALFQPPCPKDHGWQDEGR